MIMTRIRLTAAALSALLAAGLQPLHATTLPVVDSLGFETPFTTTFAPMGGGGYAGQLEGQIPGPVPPTAGGTWLQTSNAGTSTATIQTAVVDTGAQAVRVNHTSGSENRWGVPVSGWPNFGPQTAPGSPPLRYICIDWSMNVTPTTASQLGPFFGIDANDDDFNPVSRLGFAGVNSANGEVVYDTQVGLFASGVFAPLGVWNDYRMVLDYATDSYGFMVNGILATPGWVPFVDGLLTTDLNEFSDANIYSTNAGVGTAPGTAYYDNFTIVNTDVDCLIPEPSTVVLGLLAVAGLVYRRHRS